MTILVVIFYDSDCYGLLNYRQLPITILLRSGEGKALPTQHDREGALRKYYMAIRCAENKFACTEIIIMTYLRFNT